MRIWCEETRKQGALLRPRRGHRGSENENLWHTTLARHEADNKPLPSKIRTCKLLVCVFVVTPTELLRVQCRWLTFVDTRGQARSVERYCDCFEKRQCQRLQDTMSRHFETTSFSSVSSPTICLTEIAVSFIIKLR